MVHASLSLRQHHCAINHSHMLKFWNLSENFDYMVFSNNAPHPLTNSGIIYCTNHVMKVWVTQHQCCLYKCNSHITYNYIEKLICRLESMNCVFIKYVDYNIDKVLLKSGNERNTHRETVLLGSTLTSGVSVSSFPPQLTFLRAPGTEWALPRSSAQLQPLERSSGQPAETLWSSRRRNRRTQNGMRTQGPDIVPHTINCAVPGQPMTSGRNLFWVIIT